MPTLIITEKPNVAERIARSIGNPQKHSREGAPYYLVNSEIYVAPAVGHVYGLKENKSGYWSYPTFDIEWVPNYQISKNADYTRKYLENIKSLAKECSQFIVSCDYDVEGEVIGYNIVKYACGVDPLDKEKVKRMKYSTLTTESILKAYSNLQTVDKGMAEAGVTRHTLDWFWGINLSRALTLAARRVGRNVTLSIGRVQGPALKILASREKKIMEFKPELYWEVEMISLKNEIEFSSSHIKGKIKTKEEAENIKKKCGGKAVVVKVEKKTFKQNPPEPFDLTTLQTEAYKQHGIDPRRTLEIAQDLYTNAYISYPRTSSQQLPKELNFRKIILDIKKNHAYNSLCDTLLAKKDLTPNNGKKKDPAHPAIHPTGELPARLDAEMERIYDLIVRRFLATFGDPAVRQSINIQLDNNSEIFVAEGVTTLEKGWHTLYGKYAKFDEIVLPDLNEGETVKVKDVLVHEKETKPPKRYTPASIIREMEKKNLGTKATRSQIIDILFRRGYVSGKAIQVTQLGLNVVDTFDKYCPEILSEKLTRKFENEMEGIHEQKIPAEKVVEEGKKTLTDICVKFKENEFNIGKSIAASLIENLGKCHKCENGYLVFRKSSIDGSQFVGCSSYPECRNTISLPKANLKKTGICRECGYAIITVDGDTYGKPGSGRKIRRTWQFCINPMCPSKKGGTQKPKPEEEKPETEVRVEEDSIDEGEE